MRFNWASKPTLLDGIKEDVKSGKFMPEKQAEVGPQTFLERIRADVAAGKFSPKKILKSISGEHKSPQTPQKPSRTFPVGCKKSHRVRPAFHQ